MSSGQCNSTDLDDSIQTSSSPSKREASEADTTQSISSSSKRKASDADPSETISSSSKRKTSDAVASTQNENIREVAQCAICFESLSHRVELPCSCSVAYCAACWDHALAASFRSCGVARCPTCRTTIRVDVRLSPSDDCPLRPQQLLSFSRETRDAHLISSDVELLRLAKQARPLQVLLLHQHRTSIQNASSHLNTAEAPKCVCGKDLTLTTLRRRTRSCGFGSIMCDVCERMVEGGTIWTCQNGYDTVLHPASHDVCQQCFIDHVYESDIGLELAPFDSSGESGEESSGDVDSEHESTSDQPTPVELQETADEGLARRLSSETDHQRLMRMSTQTQAAAEQLRQARSAMQSSSLGVDASLRALTDRLDRLQHAANQANDAQVLRSAIAVRSAIQESLLDFTSTSNIMSPSSDRPQGMDSTHT